MARLGSIASWLLAGTIFLVLVAWTNLTAIGVGTHPFTYDDIALPRLVVALVGVASTWMFITIMMAGGFKLSWDPTWLLLGALSVWAIVAGGAASSTTVWLGQSERLEGVLTMALYALLFGAGLQLGGSKRTTRLLATALVCGAALLSIHGLLQVAELDRTSYMVGGYSFYLGSAFASLGNPNFLAGVLVLALPIAAAVGFTAPGRTARYAAWAGAVIIALALYFTYSQGAWLAVLIEIAIGVTFWLWGRQVGAREVSSSTKRSLVRAALPALGLLLVGITVIVVVTGIATQRGSRLWGSSLSETGSGRILLTQTTLNAVAARPVFGYGPDNFLAAFRLHRPARYIEVFGEASTNNNAHSWIGQYAATLGVLGAILLLAVIGCGLARSRPRWGAHGPPDLLATAIWVAAIGFLVQMMLNVAVLASTVPFWALLGAISAPAAHRLDVARGVARASVVVCGVLVAGALVVSGMLLTADATFLASRLAYNGDAAGDSVALAERAAALNPLSVKYSRAVAQSRSAQVFAAVAGNVSDAEVLTRYREAEAAFTDTLVLSPNDYAALAWLAGLQATTGTHLGDNALTSEARTTAIRASKLDVTHAGVARLLEGDTSDASARSALSVPGLP